MKGKVIEPSSLMRRIVEDADAVLVIDDTGACAFANPAAVCLLADPGSTLVGPAVRERVAALREPAFEAAFAAARTDHESIEVQISPPGTDRWLAARIVPEGPVCLVYVREMTVRRVEDVAAGRARDELRRADKDALSEGEARLRRTVEGVDAIIAFQEDPSSPMIVSPQVERILGYRPDQLVDFAAWEALVHPDDAPACRRVWDGSSEARDLTYRMRRADGEWLWVADRVRRFPHDDGRGPGMIGVVVDITERRRTEEALRIAEARRRVFFDANVVGTVVTGSQGEVIDANDYWLAIVGRGRDELERGEVDLRAVTAPESLVHDRRAIRQAADRGASDPYEKTYLRRNGKRVPALVVHAAIPGSDGEIASFVLDLSDQREAASGMAQLAAAIEQTSESVVVTDADVRIIYVNPAFERVSGYSREEVLGQNPRILKSGVQTAAFYDAMWATLSTGQTWRGDLVNRRADGSLFTEVASISPVKDASGLISAYVAVERDVTAERELEAQLRQAQRLDGIGQLAGGVAHDFNNLLTAIHGYGEMAQASLPPGSDAAEDLKQVLLAADRAGALTRQLLAFSRRLGMEPRVVDVSGVIDNFAPMLRRLLGEHIEIAVSHGPELGLVLADPGQLEQVIMNLAVNARDAMPDGGRLTIMTDNLPPDRETEEAGDPRYVRITVRDTGTGMAPETIARIFEPFFTTKEVDKGTGLGLSTVYGIVKESGGRVGVSSTPGEGTTFTIDLPRADDPVETGSDAKLPPATAAGAGERVLLVEDDAAVRPLLGRMLRHLGYRVLLAASGAEALEIAGADASSLDVLVTDIRMPGLQGPDLARRIRALRPDLPVVLITGYVDWEAIGIDDIPRAHVLQKPIRAASLNRAVRAALDA